MSTIAVYDAGRLDAAAGSFHATITAAEIAHHWNALSHFPERRASIELSELAARLNSFARYVSALADRGGVLDVTAELERFAARHIAVTRHAWEVDGRCMSAFIVGPANFPTARNRKRQDAADRAHADVSAHAESARKAVSRRAFPYGEPGDAIRANNPDAPELIREKIAERRRVHAAMKAANAAIRSVKSGDPDAMVQAVMDATGWREDRARAIVTPPQSWIGRGFATYQLAYELAEIRRLEDRLALIERNRDRGAIAQRHVTAAGPLEIVENGDAARIQLIFADKPDADTRALLKSHGFRWAPSEGAWQRHLNNNGRYAANRVLAALRVDATATA